MARSGRHTERAVNAPALSVSADNTAIDDELFLEPMMGTPLQIYIEKNVSDRDQLVEIITRHGGQVSPNYSNVPYILVDPHTEAGQTLYRQYAGKKGKIVLSSQWIHECVRANELQTYHTNWAGCRLTGHEQVRSRIAPSTNGASSSSAANATQRSVPGQTPIQQVQASLQSQPQLQHPAPPPPQQQHAQHPPPQHQLQHQPQAAQPQSHPSAAYAHQPMQVDQPQMLTAATSIGAPGFGYPVFTGQSAQRASLAAAPGGPPQTWQTAIPQHQQHIPILPPRSQNPYAREDHWQESAPPFGHMGEAHLPPMNDAQTAAYYDQRYRDGQHWVEHSHEYYDQPQTYETPYQQDQYVPMSGPSSTTIEQQTAPPATAQELTPTPGSAEASVPAAPLSPNEENRGRRRSRPQPPPPPPATLLVLSRRHPPARSPTPPTRVIKSTYGGNLFTADDIGYLKKYIDYCHEQGLVLSLREICERIALKAPHHSFYSWRRYCNKHQIRLGGYAMDADSRSPTPTRHDPGEAAVSGENSNPAVRTGDGPFTIDAAMRIYQEQGLRDRSPTPPRALYRSTTGKGVAFTSDDIAFLCKLMAYRRLQGQQDMVAFWKDVSNKAPHHSRASWMKFYRRHKHELNRVEGDEILPAAPSKKLRYGRTDDILLANYFARGVQGTSDQIFQDFAKLHPHHPWKGWQEHHRIHKAKIDHLIQRLLNGETLEVVDDDD